MQPTCPKCRKPIAFNGPQQAKLEAALAKLRGDQGLKIKCPACKNGVELKAPAPSRKQAAGSPKTGKGPAPAKGAGAAKGAAEMPKPINPPPPPPKPPDLGWLASGTLQEKAVIQDVPTAMVLMAEGPGRDRVAEAFSDLEYQLVYPESTPDAVGRMRFKDFAAIVLHTGYEGGRLADSAFHRHMRGVPMGKRRYIFYVLIGPEFNTLYDLQALTCSANLVVNDAETDHIRIILKKSMADRENLFGPLVSMLKASGKR